MAETFRESQGEVLWLQSRVGTSWAFWGESDSWNYFAKGEPGYPHVKSLSDMELVLDIISLTAQVKVDWRNKFWLH